MYVCMYVCMYAFMYVYVYIYIYMYGTRPPPPGIYLVREFLEPTREGRPCYRVWEQYCYCRSLLVSLLLFCIVAVTNSSKHNAAHVCTCLLYIVTPNLCGTKTKQQMIEYKPTHGFTALTHVLQAVERNPNIELQSRGLKLQYLPDPRFRIQDPGEACHGILNLESWIREY